MYTNSIYTTFFNYFTYIYVYKFYFIPNIIFDYFSLTNYYHIQFNKQLEYINKQRHQQTETLSFLEKNLLCPSQSSQNITRILKGLQSSSQT